MTEREAGPNEDLVADALFSGQLSLLQPRRGHRVGTDAVLLAAAASAEPGERFIDAGAGVGVVGLELARRAPLARGVLVERDPDLAALAQRNAIANGLDGRVGVTCLDLFDKAACRTAALEGSADLLVSNPPFYNAGTVRVSPDPGKAAAHVLPSASDPQAAWITRLGDLLAPRGRVLVVQRPDALPSILRALERRFGGITLKPIQARAGAPASRILVGAVRGTRAPVTILPALVLHTGDGSFTVDAEAIHCGAHLPFWPKKSRPRRADLFGLSTT